VAVPQGGFYLFPDFEFAADRLRARSIATSQAFCERLLDETGVAVLPGSAFGRPPTELTVRLSYVDFDGARALAAAGQLPSQRALDATFLEEYCGQTLTAIERLVEWLGD